MLYLVRMDVALPPAMPTDEADALRARERTYSQKLQATGVWVELWRITGEYANYSIFDTTGNDELHDILSGLPLFPYMSIAVTPLSRHPSRIDP